MGPANDYWPTDLGGTWRTRLVHTLTRMWGRLGSTDRQSIYVFLVPFERSFWGMNAPARREARYRDSIARFRSVSPGRKHVSRRAVDDERSFGVDFLVNRT